MSKINNDDDDDDDDVDGDDLELNLVCRHQLYNGNCFIHRLQSGRFYHHE